MNQTAQRAKKLFITNPMKMEVTRFRSRFLRPTESSTVNKTLLGMVVLCYAVILGSVWVFRTDVHPAVLIMIQAVLGLIAAPSAAHAVIAGERDRRSWDLLQSAPISQAEIVVGKFMGVAGLVSLLMLAFLPMIIVTGLSYHDVINEVSFSRILFSELFAGSSTLAAIAFSVNLSARLKSATSALVTSIASLVGLLAIVPLALAVILDGTRVSTVAADALLAWHPIYAIVRAWQNSGVRIVALDFWYGFPLVLFYLGLTAYFLRSAESALQKPKGE